MGQSTCTINGVVVPNLRHLRALCITARMKSVKAAANEMFISQPAVTQAILNLESLYGFSFFDRTPAGMLTTEVGAIYIRRVERALAELARGCGSQDDGFGGCPRSRFLTTSHLRVMIALTDCGSFEAAAMKLDTSRASVQRTARNLESGFDRKMFLRASGGVRLSDSAARLARCTKLAVRELEHAVEELEQHLGQKVGRMVIGSLPLSLVELVPLALMRLLDQFPDLAVRVVEGPFRHQMSRLLNGDLDMMVGALRDPSQSPSVTQLPLFSDELSVVVRRNHPLTRLDKPTLSDTIGYSWVIPPAGTPTRELFHNAFRRRALLEPKRLLEVSSHTSLRSVLAGSDRVAMISRRQIRFEEEARLLTVLPIALPEANRVIGLTTRADWAPTIAQLAFMEELRAVASEYEADEASSGGSKPGINRIQTGAFPAPG